MEISRCAYIVGSSQSVHGQLPGVDADRSNYRAFLRSSAGGAWEAYEIVDLVAPSAAELRKALYGHGLDYALVAFLGHGSRDADSDETMLCLNDREEVSVTQLNTGSPRQLTIVDACRTLRSTAIVDHVEKRAEILSKATDAYRASCRALFASAVLAAEVGISRVFSCAVGQAAGETHRGGTFSRALLEGAEAWAETVRPKIRATSMLDVSAAYRRAEEALRNAREPQTPALENGRRHRSFPFAVA